MNALRELIAAAEAAGWDADAQNAPILDAARDALPEMVGALQVAAKALRSARYSEMPAYEVARAALAKATGGEA
jgi:hypothetical protein